MSTVIGKLKLILPSSQICGNGENINISNISAEHPTDTENEHYNQATL